MTMNVLLAGYNLDFDLIDELKAKSGIRQELTPETLSAAYARISRSPKPVDELRQDARQEVDKARRSNRNIVFDMGHSSVAEHAVFNIDVIGVSRRLVEEIEKFRLCAYTEKSQRYVLFDKDYVVPDEIRGTPLCDGFIETIEIQNALYAQLYKELRPYVFEKHTELASDPSNKNLLEGWAKEDARYSIALATETQLGMTINARNLELMVRRLAALPLAEARAFAQRLHDVTQRVAPSLIRYTEATDYDRLTRKKLRAALESHHTVITEKSPEARLIATTPDADARAAAALCFATSGMPYPSCLKAIRTMSPADLRVLFKTAFAHLMPYDAVLREMEMVEMDFELVMSASCFAQFKRHRMATVLTQDYDPALGVTVPPAVSAIGRRKDFLAVIRQTDRMYDRIRETHPEAASYVLTNAHRKRVLFKCNARELYHVARLRADAHAQWDIRALTRKMLTLAKKAMPLTLMMACGKDEFSRRRTQIYPKRT